MHAFGLVATKFFKKRREQMLTGMLLHVVEAPRPVHHSGDIASDAKRRWHGEHVRDL